MPIHYSIFLAPYLGRESATHFGESALLDFLSRAQPTPSEYSCSEAYWRDRIPFDLLRKADLPLGVDTERAAIDAFMESEQRCFKTNRRLSELPGLVAQAAPRFVWNFLQDVKRDVGELLGKLPEWLDPVFTGGSTLTSRYDTSTLPDKLSGPLSYYHDTALVFPMLRKTAWWSTSADQVSPERFNRFFTVPKSWKTRRGCCKEAVVSLAYQRALGVVIRKRLLTWGIDLQVAEDVHHELARRGSATGLYSTIDLRQASDSLAYELVRLVLPESWFNLLDSLRAPATWIDGRVVRLEKFSSMGNGFTFELETMVFAAVCRSILRRLDLSGARMAVYGDDIIVPTAASEPLISALKYLGFDVNSDKTFTSGPFRESCGGDFFNGTAVPTVKLEKIPESPEAWISLHNNLLRVASGLPDRTRYLAPLLNLCLEAVPRPLRVFGPRRLGDLVFHSDLPSDWRVEWKTPKKESTTQDLRHLKHAHVRALLPVPSKVSYSSGIRRGRWNLTSCLLSCIAGSGSSGVIPRGSVEGYRLSWVPLSFAEEQLVG